MPGNVQEINCCCLQAIVISKKGAGGNKETCRNLLKATPAYFVLQKSFSEKESTKTHLTAFQGNNVLQHQKKIKTHQPINQSYCRVNQV